MVNMAVAKKILPFEMPTSKCCNSGTSNNTGLKFGVFHNSYICLCVPKIRKFREGGLQS